MGVASGTVHRVPADLRELVEADATFGEQWASLTPLGRNEFICWVEDAKKPETRAKRLRRTREEIVDEGKRRPCCWPGCSHREKNGR